MNFLFFKTKNSFLKKIVFKNRNPNIPKSCFDICHIFYCLSNLNLCYDFLNRVAELPPVEMFVTTTDPILEPPIMTVNTVLSLLAVDYPVNKLACYVSDDGGSFLTFYALLEASKFAKLWVPFCKKYGIPNRAPFRNFYYEEDSPIDDSAEFLGEYTKMKVNQTIT